MTEQMTLCHISLMETFPSFNYLSMLSHGKLNVIKLSGFVPRPGRKPQPAGTAASGGEGTAGCAKFPSGKCDSADEQLSVGSKLTMPRHKLVTLAG
ncbi:hypothetical protein [Herbaspirillum robiniae]|uniref:Uncharacterized protein n=1 Tax=Herbaspirillum robiniae TaxID=2014887 RepID=A0ABX2LWF7_9BURK|nr:hypothetical protein [Herbaspirillum robiniae]NUU02807.1 hypothetical protein [Herbaspirillum robiniae]